MHRALQPDGVREMGKQGARADEGKHSRQAGGGEQSSVTHLLQIN